MGERREIERIINRLWKKKNNTEKEGMKRKSERNGLEGEGQKGRARTQKKVEEIMGVFEKRGKIDGERKRMNKEREKKKHGNIIVLLISLFSLLLYQSLSLPNCLFPSLNFLTKSFVTFFILET